MARRKKAPEPTPPPTVESWIIVFRDNIDGGVSPWGFSQIGLSASGRAERQADPSLKLSVTDADGGNAFARGIVHTSIQAGYVVRYRFGLYLPEGFGASVVGSMQISRLDPYPTLNNAQGLIYDAGAKNWRLFVKDNGRDSDITGRFTLAEGERHMIEVQTLLHATDGWATVSRNDQALVRASGVKTIYAPGDGTGTRVSRFRVGLVAIGSTLQKELSLRIDDVELSVA